MTTPRLYRGTNPADMATLMPGHYYWMQGWNVLGPVIVHIRNGVNGRVISDGCEYTEWRLMERVDVARECGELASVNFWGPIAVPSELAAS